MQSALHRSVFEEGDLLAFCFFVSKMPESTPTFLMVPGLRDHVPEHWQTLLQAKLQAEKARALIEP